MNNQRPRKFYREYINSSVDPPMYLNTLSIIFRQFTSVDPAPPSSLPHLSTSTPASHIDSLRSTLTSPTLPLFERYRAMFALRNIAGSRRKDAEKSAVEALASGFSDDSELFKYVPNFFSFPTTPVQTCAPILFICQTRNCIRIWPTFDTTFDSCAPARPA
jgi:hypothetical protein